MMTWRGMLSSNLTLPQCAAQQQMLREACLKCRIGDSLRFKQSGAESIAGTSKLHFAHRMQRLESTRRSPTFRWGQTKDGRFVLH
jgi:hypothetical protein